MIVKNKCLIIGAGMAGLIAGKKLQDNGIDVTIIDKGRGVGGRMATRRIANSVFDHGTQFFTARETIFKAYVSEWLKKGVIRIWGELENFKSEPAMSDNEPVYIGAAGMTSLAKHLATDLELELNRRVIEINYLENRWEVKTETGEIFQSDAVILTPPVPQSLEIVQSGNLTSFNGRQIALDNIRYQACITLMVLFEGIVDLPSPGILHLSGEPLTWIVDNQRKGISKGASALTIQTGPEFSRKYWEQNDEMLAKNILYVASGWLKSAYTSYQLKRWLYSRPASVFHQPFFSVQAPLPLVLAGDAFGGPRVEGAAISGLAAAEEILKSIDK